MFSFAPVGLSSSNDCVSAFAVILHRPLCYTVYPSLLTYQFTRVEGSTSPIQGSSSSRSSKEDWSIREKRKKNKEPPQKDGDQYKSLLERLGHERRSRKRHHSTASRNARFLLLFLYYYFYSYSFTHHFLFDLSRRLSLLLYRIALISVIPGQLSVDSRTHVQCSRLPPLFINSGLVSTPKSLQSRR